MGQLFTTLERSEKLFWQKNLWNCVKYKPVGILTCIFEPTCLLTLSESTGASHHIFLFVNENWWFRTLSQLLLQADAAAAIQVFENCRKDFPAVKAMSFFASPSVVTSIYQIIVTSKHTKKKFALHTYSPEEIHIFPFIMTSRFFG